MQDEWRGDRCVSCRRGPEIVFRVEGYHAVLARTAAFSSTWAPMGVPTAKGTDLGRGDPSDEHRPGDRVSVLLDTNVPICHRAGSGLWLKLALYAEVLSLYSKP